MLEDFAQATLDLVRAHLSSRSPWNPLALLGLLRSVEIELVLVQTL